MRRLAPRELSALAVLAVILAITAAWWALALWPLPGDAPSWLVRTRDVCFGTASNGLPTNAGWMALIGQPVYMLATLWLISGQSLRGGLQALAQFPAGRSVLWGSAAVIVTGFAAAGVRVAQATTMLPAGAPPPAIVVADVPQLDQPAPPLALIDQHGKRVTLGQFRGRVVFVTFAFAHCETVCPLVVHDVLQAQADLPELNAAVIVVTLDPWRDGPSRLPAIAAQWNLGTRAHVLSGGVADVERTLDEWHVGRARDARTGDVTHAAIVYVIDRSGRIAFAVTGAGAAATFAGLARRL
jgi:cytochrome oxidase Cu insertion factor (SCO1/SenC/PrrC family)